MLDDDVTRLRFDDGRPIDNLNTLNMASWSSSDDNKSRSWTANKSSNSKGDFFYMLIGSKHLVLQLPIYGNGTQIAEFSTIGLDPTIFDQGKNLKRK